MTSQKKMTFDDELREIALEMYYNSNRSRSVCDVDVLVKTVNLLIAKYLPKKIGNPLQQVLGMEEPKADDVKYTKCPCEKLVDHNQMLIDDYRLWLTKKLLELERIIAEFIPHRDSEYIKPLAQAIRQMLIGKE